MRTRKFFVSAIALIAIIAALPAAADPEDGSNRRGTAQGIGTDSILRAPSAPDSDSGGRFFLSQAATARDVPSTWTWAGALYLHAVGLSGRQAIGGAEVDLDVSFGDLFDKIQGGFMGHFEGRNGNFGFGVDYMWVKVGEEGIELGPEGGPGVLPVEGTGSMTTSAFELFGTYRIGDQADGPGALDLIGGTRYKSVANKIEITGGPLEGLSADPEFSWWDIMFGGRWMRQAGERAILIFRADLGSDAWNVQGGVGINVWRQLDVVIEYRHIKYNRSEGTGAERFVYDASESGPLFGIGFHF